MGASGELAGSLTTQVLDAAGRSLEDRASQPSSPRRAIALALDPEVVAPTKNGVEAIRRKLQTWSISLTGQQSFAISTAPPRPCTRIAGLQTGHARLVAKCS